MAGCSEAATSSGAALVRMTSVSTRVRSWPVTPREVSTIWTGNSGRVTLSHSSSAAAMPKQGLLARGRSTRYLADARGSHGE